MVDKADKADKAVVLLSGGLDSATALAIARNEGYQCFALSFDYGQRNRVELEAARRVANAGGVAEHRILNLPIGELGGSALTDDAIDLPKVSEFEDSGIPVTYVPARNTVFLSMALAMAEIYGARDIFIGANAVDYSGYPDCRPGFILAFENLANLATREGVQGEGFRIRAPLIDMSKADIINTGVRLGVDYSLTISCYNPSPDGLACGVCDSCHLRADGFNQTDTADPTVYWPVR
ncbi:7-cyano-7-deazaguanine synthase [bacterium BMS3Bbin11]|nr:7-cyano-7-deazaguanine synthase [bacterium BMS3Abin11]GBE46399.1 7-cyano-7-deazaguanine synthase [bacterium BMS3Bbin11]